ncbi:MAG: hypothetical protein AW09_003037 [Candidatus Accumulibacter phosphatis]|uniref:Uncharacterized protein n=1 Tax=Candidatus Accumulibacter phosphatis TaxID=327160 RepID=A0A080LTN6_9PROT|nr:MAG: hypothetical protein AW09_003037 [Candidatus Accumulibacter phosphatis]
MLSGHRIIGLLEVPEEPPERAGGNADAGIADLEAQHQVVLAFFLVADADPDAALWGEPDRVADVIEQGLPEACRVAKQWWAGQALAIAR